jgi:hypothetical protein
MGLEAAIGRGRRLSIDVAHGFSDRRGIGSGASAVQAA